MTYKGHVIVTPSGDPSTLLHHYQFKMLNSRIMAEGQLTWLIRSFTIFSNAGLGVARITTKNYSELPVDENVFVVFPPFQSRTTCNLAYQIGFGVGYAFNVRANSDEFQHERLSLGYRYVNWGSAAFSKRSRDYPYQLKLGRISSDEVYFAYTHLF